MEHDPSLGYQIGINKFSDISTEEFLSSYISVNAGKIDINGKPILSFDPQARYEEDHQENFHA